jgi:hypothetical protein
MPDWATTLVSGLVSAASGLTGVGLGSWLATWRAREERRLAFRRQQLEELYAPLLAACEEGRARIALRQRISSEADAAWRALFEGIKDPEAKARIMAQESPAYERIIKYDNDQLTRDTLPTCRDMVDRFRRNLWLAEPSTRELFQPLLEFVELWDRWMSEALPSDVIIRLRHSGAVLENVRTDAIAHVAALRRQLESGEPG